MGVPDPERLAADLAPTAELLANMVSDPLIVFGEASKIAQLKIPKEFIGKIPKRIVDSLETLKKTEQTEKLAALKGRLTEALGQRKDYMRWWEDEAIPELSRREAGAARRFEETVPTIPGPPPEAIAARKARLEALRKEPIGKRVGIEKPTIKVKDIKNKSIHLIKDA